MKFDSGIAAMATLFRDGVRQNQGALRPGGNLFQFYDTCGRRGFDEFRAIVNGWLSEYSEDDGALLAAQMQRGRNDQFEAGMVELFVHALLERRGYGVTCHPALPHTRNRPDFAVNNQDGRLLAYVEVTTNNPAKEEIARSNIEATIHNAIDAASLPEGCLIGFCVERSGTATPPLNQLVASVERWARENAACAREHPLSRVFAAGDWEIELDLYAGVRGASDGHCIGITGGNVHWIGPSIDIRYCLEQKAKKYGHLDAPYLIAVADCADQIAFRENGVGDALTAAVLGDEVIAVRSDGTGELRRKPNGFFGWPQGPKHTHVSAVLVVPDAGLWRLRHMRCQPMMALHPWAEVALPQEFLGLPKFEWSHGRWEFELGTLAADVLGLPNPWPPEDD